MERTLALIKPGAVRAGYVDAIVDIYLKADLRIVRLQVFRFTPDEAANFYIEHKGKDFFERLVQDMCSDTTVALVLEGDDSLRKVRNLNGPSKEVGNRIGSIRHKYKARKGVVHGADSAEAVNREISIIFRERTPNQLEEVGT